MGMVERIEWEEIEEIRRRNTLSDYYWRDRIGRLLAALEAGEAMATASERYWESPSGDACDAVMRALERWRRCVAPRGEDEVSQ